MTDATNEKRTDRPGESARKSTVDTAELLERIRLRWETLGDIDVSDETIRELRDAGRP